MEPREQLRSIPNENLLTIEYRQGLQLPDDRPLSYPEADISSSDSTDTAFDLWDECIVQLSDPSQIPSSDQQDYAHDLGLISVSGENNVKSNPTTRASSSTSLSDCSTQTIFGSMSLSAKVQEAFCDCYKGKKIGVVMHCLCGEEDTEFDWMWDNDYKSWATQLQDDSREVRFHKHYSSGTAAIRGSRLITCGQHYWEIKMISPVYGTDMMIGVGTAEVDLQKSGTIFCSLLGSDNESWGLSYTGVFHHNGKSQRFSQCFGQGSIIGVHLDMWNGTLSYYKNRRPLGIACGGLKGKKLYPMVSSTAARSAMKVVCSRSFESSLQYFCCLALRKMVPSEASVFESIRMPPGLKNFLSNNLGWILGPVESFSCWRSSSRHHCATKKSSNCSLFLVDKSKTMQLGMSQSLVYSNQHCHYCYRHGGNLSKRRKHMCEKQKLLFNIMNSSDESDDESSDFEVKRKH